MRTLEIAWLATALAGCSTTDSEDVKTSGIWADMSATATGEGTTGVDATLYLGSPLDLNFVRLTGGDELVAIHDNNRKVLEEREFLNIVGHYTSFQVDAEGEEFRLQLLRIDGDDALDSYATIPAPFTMDVAPAMASRAEALTLSWTTAVAPEPMDWIASGDCVPTVGGAITAPNTVTIAAGTIKANDETRTCNITIDVYRRRSGDLDSNLKGGAMRGQQRRRVTISSTP